LKRGSESPAQLLPGGRAIGRDSSHTRTGETQIKKGETVTAFCSNGFAPPKDTISEPQ